MADIEGKSSGRRYSAKLSHLLRQGYAKDTARNMARGYAGGKHTTKEAGGAVQDQAIGDAATGKAAAQMADNMPTMDMQTMMQSAGMDTLPTEVQKLPDKAQAIWMRSFMYSYNSEWNTDKATEYAWNTVKNSYKQDGETWIALDDIVFGFIRLAEVNTDTSDIEIMRVGKWDHPVYGKIAITTKDLDGFAQSFADKVRGVDLAVDLEHGATDVKGAAAGWFKEVKRVGNSLMATVAWTELGIEKLKAGIYRYFSPEFRFTWKEEESGNTYSNVLFGGGLTNRPFIKNMHPVLLSEDIMDDLLASKLSELADVSALEEREEVAPEGNSDDQNKEEIKGDSEMAIFKKLAEMFKLSEDASAEQIEAAIIGLAETNTQLSEEVTNLKTLNGTLEAAKSTLETDSKKLSERITDLEGKSTLAEWETLKTVAMSEGRMTAKQVEAFKARFISDPAGTRELVALMEPVVALGEIGTARRNDKNAVAMFETKVQEIMQSDAKLQYSQAVVLAEKQNPDLMRDVQAERTGKLE